jgi:outer membrane translocation and assembly module TamA
MAGIRGELDFEIYENLHISCMGNLFAAQELNRPSGFSLIAGYGVGIGYMSIIGPLRIGIMHGRYKQETFFRDVKGYISFGYSF